MKLFGALFRKKMPRGNIWRGKQRLVKPVTISDVQTLRNDFAIEEQNMFYLRHPYLTIEQSSGHAQALGKKAERMMKLLTIKKEFKENVTIEDMLGHLKFKEAWD